MGGEGGGGQNSKLFVFNNVGVFQVVVFDLREQFDSVLLITRG